MQPLWKQSLFTLFPIPNCPYSIEDINEILGNNQDLLQKLLQCKLLIRHKDIYYRLQTITKPVKNKRSFKRIKANPQNEEMEALQDELRVVKLLLSHQSSSSVQNLEFLIEKWRAVAITMLVRLTDAIGPILVSSSSGTGWNSTRGMHLWSSLVQGMQNGGCDLDEVVEELECDTGVQERRFEAFLI